jgi:hypothetical protein
MRRIISTAFVATIAIALALASPAIAKEKEEGGSAGTVVAIGNVNTGGMGFSSMPPKDLSELFRLRAKKQLEKKGNYSVILPEPKDTPVSEQDQPGDITKSQKPPKTAAEAMKYAAQMQEQYQTMMAQSRGYRAYYPVEADALFDFNVSTGSKYVTSGGVFSQIEGMTGAPVGDADFNSDSINMTLTCLRRDPKTGRLMDEYKAKASSTKVARVGGVSYYTMEDTSDPDRAFDRTFKRSMDTCIKWIAKQLR